MAKFVELSFFPNGTYPAEAGKCNVLNLSSNVQLLIEILRETTHSFFFPKFEI